MSFGVTIRRMISRILPFLLLLILMPGCVADKPKTANSVNLPGTKPDASVQPSASPAEIATRTPHTFALDLVGQDARIFTEGSDEDQIRANIAATDKAITYEHLKKNADKYAGKPWFCKGKILEITEQSGLTVARIGLDDWGTKTIWVMGLVSTDFVEKNTVYVVGYLAGNYSYTSQANWQITVPALAIRAMIKPSDWPKYQKGKNNPST